VPAIIAYGIGHGMNLNTGHRIPKLNSALNSEVALQMKRKTWLRRLAAATF
jgi:hypothetical protein